jgi:biopolymer transport protein ExbB/TolQ
MLQQVVNFIVDSGFVGWTIITTGFFAISIIAERIKKLFFDFHMNTDSFTKRIQHFVSQQRFEEALILCEGLSHKPIARAFKTILLKADREEEAIQQAADIALSENMPLFNKRIHYLSMLANVATLLGLLGTIHGLILSFQAVATADPSQKQALLAHGISVSMYTTALGLAVAIPVMIAYSFLVSRQNQLSEELFEQVQKLEETLTGVGPLMSVTSSNSVDIGPEVPKMTGTGNYRNS